jgi:hypothetical protein
MNDSRKLKIGLTIFAAVIAILHAAYPKLLMDGVTLGLIVVAILPWLSPIIKSVDLPGIGKIELQEIKQQVHKLQGQTESAARKAETALAGNINANVPNKLAVNEASRETVKRLANKYDEIRLKFESGELRTAAMSEVVAELMASSSFISPEDVPRFLSDRESGGMRLVAYVSLYVFPRPELLSDLIKTVTLVEGTPFGQYWGIQAIRRVIQTSPKTVTPQVRDALTSFLTTLNEGTDRHYELSKVLLALKAT